MVVLGSITSRCSGNEPALLWEDQENGGNRAYGGICVLFKYIKKLTKPILLLVFVFRLTQSKTVFVFPQKRPPPPKKKKNSSMIMNLSVHDGCVRYFENGSICYLCEGYLSHDQFQKLDLKTISWNVFRRSPGRINNQFHGSCETSSPLLLFVWVARSSIPKRLERFSSLSSVIGNLVEKKRRKCKFHRHN